MITLITYSYRDFPLFKKPLVDISLEQPNYSLKQNNKKGIKNSIKYKKL